MATKLRSKNLLKSTKPFFFSNFNLFLFSKNVLVKPFGEDDIKAERKRLMGRKAGGLFISPKKFGSVQKPCMKEMLQFLNCLAINQSSDNKCLKQKELLSTCMNSKTANKGRKPWGSINFNLQRLTRGRK